MFSIVFFFPGKVNSFFNASLYFLRQGSQGRAPRQFAPECVLPDNDGEFKVLSDKQSNDGSPASPKRSRRTL
jgi:hypothetical protein